MTEKQVLLCHIDHTPCKDTAWVNAKKRAGLSKQLSEKNFAKLKAVMKKTEKNYLTVVSIEAASIEILE